MSEARRIRIGILGMLLGLLILAIGIAVAHFTGLPTQDPVTGQAVLPGIPRGWPYVTAGQVVGLAGSQIAAFAFLYGWILDRPLTWARAGVGAFIAWFELVLIYAIIPSEWLNLTQGPLGWSARRTLVTIPRFLVLNNEINISYAALKDAISGAWYALTVGGLIVFTYKVQERAKHPPARPQRVSPYGRPLVPGGGPGLGAGGLGSKAPS